MGIERLVEKLQSQSKTVDEHWAEKKLEWIEDVAVLATNIEEWLAPAVEQRLARVERRKLELDEPDTGPYEIDALTIHLGDREVRVEPRGMRVVGVVGTGAARIVGARGRVDLVSGPARATILRRADRTWQLATVDGWPTDKSAVPLTADTLADALAELIA
ncbi:MAG TPA: hypothetical protein VL242_11800 [Sorangium sp.]|nr:hypothetical protein [Sorangium sp.]